MNRSIVVLLVAISVCGCAAAPPPPPPAIASPVAPPVDSVRRIVVVPSGESKFAVDLNDPEPGRTFDEVLKYNPYPAALVPVFRLVHMGINWLLGFDNESDSRRHVTDVSPHSIVSATLAHTLDATGAFEEVRAVEREPVGDARGRAEAVVRVTVARWGLVRVRAGDPDLLSAFADVKCQMIRRGTGTVIWEHVEDVTSAERWPLHSFTKDGELARRQLTGVLERAGQRLANEFLYAQGVGR